MEIRALSLIHEKGGIIIGEIFTKGRSKCAKIRCSNGHIFEPRFDNIVYSNSWCPACYGNTPHSIEEMQALAKSRGGKVLSEKYQGNKIKLRWQCSLGHKWEASPNNVLSKASWCPSCVFNVGEELVRSTLEEAFPEKKFTRTRSEIWMDKLELDGYNSELKLAFEYNGIQHSEQTKHFHRKENAFDLQLERDKLTKERCKSNGVTLLIIPHTIPYQKIRPYVRQQLRDLNYDIIPDDKLPDDLSFYNSLRGSNVRIETQNSRIMDVIRKKGGELMPDSKYLGYRLPISIKCKEGHIFTATPEDIDQPIDRGIRFCPECAKNPTKTSTDAIKLRIKKRGYIFHSIEERKSKKAPVRYITISCNESHDPFEIGWSKFNRSKNSDVLCPECAENSK